MFLRGAVVSFRRRTLGPFLAFAAAVLVVGSARAQRPQVAQDEPQFGGRQLSQDQVKAAIERLLNRGKGLPDLPPGLSPEQLAEMMQRLKMGARPGQQPDPRQFDELRRLLENPEFRKQLENWRAKGGPPPDFTKGGPPVGPDRKFDPPPFKLDPPVKRPPDGPPPRFKDKLDPGPQPPPQPPPPAPPQPPVLDREKAPWEQPESAQDKARQAAASMWERAVGPLDETPAVKKALFDLADGTLDIKDPDGNSLWDTVSKELGDGKSLGDVLDGFDPGEGWKFGDWEFPKFDWNFNWGNNKTPNIDLGGNGGPAREGWLSRMFRRSPSSPSSSGPSWFSNWRLPRWNLNVGSMSVDGRWLYVVLLIALVVAGVILWRKLAGRWGTPAGRIDPYALGPWPVDPHRLSTRQDVVVAFEHLSVLICGPVAKTWTHTTIAGALAQMATAEPERALMLARLYELARYTPVEEPLTTAELAEARRLVCRLAGFDD